MSARVTLYSKPGCHLCADVRALLDEIQHSYQFVIDEIDITSDDELFTRYRYEIPVLLIDGDEVGRGLLAERDVLKAFEGRPR